MEVLEQQKEREGESPSQPAWTSKMTIVKMAPFMFSPQNPRPPPIRLTGAILLSSEYPLEITPQ